MRDHGVIRVVRNENWALALFSSLRAKRQIEIAFTHCWTAIANGWGRGSEGEGQLEAGSFGDENWAFALFSSFRAMRQTENTFTHCWVGRGWVGSVTGRLNPPPIPLGAKINNCKKGILKT